MTSLELHHLAANTLRALAIDATNAADSGHPGAPLGMADLAVVLFTEFLRFDPSEPRWINRDRFVLSNGHASMLLYGLLHLSGYNLTLDDLRRFRQLGSKTAGHPEYGLVPGVETTTGPLGQGFTNAVGMAIGARMAQQRFGGQGFEPVDHQVYCFCGDGCLMEGISSEAASLAGHLGLGELVYIYDDNKISIDGPTDITFTEDVGRRFQAYGWHVLSIDGHDPASIRAALAEGKAERKRPTLIMARTHIGYGSPNRQDSAEAHGSPLGAKEGDLTKERLGWSRGPFEIPEEARALFRAAADRGKAQHEEWKKGVADWSFRQPELGRAFDDFVAQRRPQDLYQEVVRATGNENTATRNASGKALNAIAAKLPGLVGGSADLAASNKSLIKGAKYLSRDHADRNIAFGVREHAMGAVINGLALYGGYVPYGATFLTFSDYMRPAIRLAALMKIRSLFVFTHDSIYLGEDGPTHQAVEHVWALRIIPGLSVWRPADGMETAMAWSYAVAEGPEQPHALCLTRQNLPPIPQPQGFDPRVVWKGGYVVHDVSSPKLVLVATGSEVHVALAAAQALELEGLAMRVVSMPCLERFNAQDEAYRGQVLPKGLPRVTLELGRTTPWASIAGLDGLTLGLDRFGESGPYEQLAEHFGMTAAQVAGRVAAWWADRRT